MKRPVAVYFIAVAVLVALYFIFNPLLARSFQPDDVNIGWHVLDVMALIGLTLALGFNYVSKRDEETTNEGTALTRRYLESRVIFYLNAGLILLFLNNWLAFLVLGNDSFFIWAIVDTLTPFTLGLTGCRLWREGA